MPVPRLCCLCFMVAFFASLYFGTETVSKSGCEGDPIELCRFSFDINFTLVIIYKMDVQIGMLSIKNSVFWKDFSDEYKDKLVFEIDGNVNIRNLHRSDEAKYIIQIRKNNNESYVCEVQLVVWVAPTTNCTPKINRVDDVLIVQLEANDCGKPVPSVHWLNHSGTFFEETKALKLPPGKHAGVYHACIEGDALTCAKSSKISDYCSFFRVDEGEPLAGDAGVGVSENNKEQGKPSPNKEGAGNIGDNTVNGIDLTQPLLIREIILTIEIVLVFVCIMILLCTTYRFWKVKEESSQDHEGSENAANTGVEVFPAQLSQDHEEPGNAANSGVEESAPFLRATGKYEELSQDHKEPGNAAKN